ncbi:hypothetical protein LSH36_2216g00002 [Paralvinella palmiformis]|uniref:Uncharacterized protein n=1 Tax=Paralvinella palmiformis TaxID=53620 RepID=A0AAD9IQZ5_9ANNE|nr:hypothetical protein LSH36_2216g00002 [Paralvinella palmiformis]
MQIVFTFHHFSSKTQFIRSEVAETQEIATFRIYVERVIQRVKDNNLFKTVTPSVWLELFVSYGPLLYFLLIFKDPS